MRTEEQKRGRPENEATNHSVNVHVLCVEVVMHVVCSVMSCCMVHCVVCMLNMATTVF